MINIHFVKSLSRMKLAGMQTLDSLGAKEKQPLSIQMTCSFLYEYTAYATDTSEIFTVLFGNRRCFISKKVFITNCHKVTYSCLLEFLFSEENRKGNVIFLAFVSLKDPFPPKNCLSQRSRLLRIQH